MATLDVVGVFVPGFDDVGVKDGGVGCVEMVEADEGSIADGVEDGLLHTQSVQLAVEEGVYLGMAEVVAKMEDIHKSLRVDMLIS